ncbi:hypothetical protein WH297_06875 [Ochrobactrum vermis]|uniref:Uncharacterized protein n=1 Tax=Ochrobactrum vermis TaxID=1827297 RepID=A0ABU8PB33_9HYPH|nr:hypothetical protein [Ochrobactrum vermis]
MAEAKPDGIEATNALGCACDKTGSFNPSDQNAEKRKQMNAIAVTFLPQSHFIESATK